MTDPLPSFSFFIPMSQQAPLEGATLPTPFSPSPEQSAIFDFIRPSGRGFPSSLIVEAVAGSGKTTTLVHALSHLPSGADVLFLAFNKTIATTLQSKAGTLAECKTFHALGFAALKKGFPRITVDFKKASKVIFSLFKRDHPDARSAIRALSLLKTVFPFPSSQSEAGTLLAESECDFEDPKSLGRVLVALERTLGDTSSCDFDDMLAMPLRHSCPFPTFSYVLVDEAQDTNDVQLEILTRLHKTGKIKCANCGAETRNNPRCPHDEDGVHETFQYPSPTRFLFVGDPNQAIYAFRGANADSMDRIAARFATTSLPLSTTYRCPKLHVELARHYSKPQTQPK